MFLFDNNKTNANIDYDSFGDIMLDGRLTEQSDGKIYRLREVITYSKMLGRELSGEEMKIFEVYNCKGEV